MMQHEENGTTIDLVRYRLSSAEGDLRAAQILYEAGEYRGANNRAYYSLFHAINAVHALHGKAYKRHKDALANFNKDYVKTEIFPREIGRKIGAAEEIRHASDYDDFYLVNTKGSVPALELDDGQVLTEGAAIVQYLGDQVPEKELIPLPKTMERYRVMEWLNFIATELQKSFTPIFNPAYTSCREEAKKTLLRQFDFVDRRLTGKSYVMGERFTVVDAYLFTISTWIEAAELSVDQWKALSAYRKRISERPAVCRAMMAEGLV